MKRITILMALSALITTYLFSAGPPLTFEERVNAQEAIERVYYEHRIWPRENPQPKPSFESMMSRESLEAKVEDYLKKSATLEKYWKRPITAKQLQAEMDRMAKGTQASNTLKELFAALNNDPYLIAECFARPTLVDRLINNWYAYDSRFHSDLRKQVEALHAELTLLNFVSLGGERYKRVWIEQVDDERDLSVRDTGLDVIELAEEDFQLTVAKFPPEGEILPVEETRDSFIIYFTEERSDRSLMGGVIRYAKVSFDSWWKSESPGIVLSESHREDRVFILPPLSPGIYSHSDDYWANSPQFNFPCLSARSRTTSVWTGTEMIIWGGWDGIDYPYLNTGGRYNPATDTWRAVSTGADCPTGYMLHSAVWTGSEMIIWGGGDSGSLNTGGRYDPVTDTWRATATGANCPSARAVHTAVWTGVEMIIWGGYDGSLSKTGGRYDPVTDTWRATSTGANSPSGRRSHTAVWTGNEMIIWGGSDGSYLNTGGRYNPVTDIWIPTSTDSNCPSVRTYHTVVWTGAEMIIWGGWTLQDGSFNTGGRYDPTTNTWRTTAIGASCPTARSSYTVVWTGTEMIIWGGSDGSYLNTGGRYDPATDTWRATSTGANCPLAREVHTAVWTGAEMIIWGGSIAGGYSNTGGRYDPATDIWTTTFAGANCPLERYGHGVVWTGSEMIIWGGSMAGNFSNTGGQYDPAIDIWTLTATGVDSPSGRYGHTAVWSGIEMIIWGGYDGSYSNTGGRYNPTTDTWAATSTGANCPSTRYNQHSVWTGIEMIVWGGYDNNSYSYTNTGGRYDPSADAWTITSTDANCPSGRSFCTTVWTGTEMIIWGGWTLQDDFFNTGSRYDPVTDTWRATSTDVDCPSARRLHTAIWTGTEMIIWGGYDGSNSNTGGRYDPATDEWITTSTGEDSPSGRYRHTAVWTGIEMIVWGGWDGIDYLSLNTGGRYDPVTDMWSPTSTGVSCPSARNSHTVVWTGIEMIIWGGSDGRCLNTGGRYRPSGLSNRRYFR